MTTITEQTIIAPIRPTQDLPSEETEITPPDEWAHFVRKTELMFKGNTVTALCGKRWIPNLKFKNAEAKPTCPKCKELMAMLESMDGV